MPPPGGKDKAAEERFANFMTSTAGGTQGSSSYGVNTPSTGTDTSSPNYPGGSVVDQAIQNFQNQQQIQEEFEKEREDKDPSPLVQAELDKRKEKKKGFDVIGTIKDFYNEYKNFGGVLGLGLIPFKLIAEPTVATFQNPQALATLKLLFDKKGQKFKDEYLKDHGDLISEAYANDPTKEVRGLSDSEFFDEQLQEGAFASEQGILGAGSQRINFPAEFYTGEKGLNPYGAGGMPQTTGDLVNLASLAVTPEMQGTNPELVKMIFDARAQLDSMGKNPFTGNPQGGGGGQGIVAAAPSQPIDIINPKRPGPIVPDPTQPNLIMPTPLKPVGVAGLGNYPSFFPFLYNNAYTNQGLPSAYSNILSKYYGFA